VRYFMQGYDPKVAQRLISERLGQFREDILEQRGDVTEIQAKALSDIDHILGLVISPSQLLFPSNHSFNTFLTETKLSIFAEGLNSLQQKYNFQLAKPQKSKPLHRHEHEDFIQIELETSAEPHVFKLQDEQLIDNEGNVFQITKRLEGRGQEGMANFYSDGKKEHLIKEDDAATCVLEGTAYMVRDAKLLPSALENAANFATVGVITTGAPKPMVLSVQPRVMPSQKGGRVMPWDVIVYGAKREPKTLISWESWYAGKVSRGIAELNSSAQWQLAAGIFTSQVVGDESLHIGQFMADVDEENNIVGIKRIDFGARERYAVSRDVSREANPYTTSKQYQSIGQFGKDYCGAMLSNPQLGQKVTLLWARLDAMGDIALRKTIYENSKAAFLKQFAVLPDEQKQAALDGILKAINNPSKASIGVFDPITADGDTLDAQIASVADKIALLDGERAITMKYHAVAKFKSDIKAFNEEFAKYMPGDERLESLTVLKEKMVAGITDDKHAFELLASFDREIVKLIEEVREEPSEEAYHKIRLLSQANVELLEMVHLNEMHIPTGMNLKAIDADVRKYQTFIDCASYCLRSTVSLHKKTQVSNIMREANKGTLNDYLMKHPGIVASLSTHSSTVGALQHAIKTTKTEGEYLARKLFKRYGIDLAYLKLTPVQRLMLAQAEARNFRELRGIIDSATIHDAIAKDPLGRTTLHYLMENANADDLDSIDAIAIILQKSLGATYNTNLDIADRQGKTPLHVLLENPDAARIIGEINKRKISYGYMYGVNEMQHFFKDPSKYTKGELDQVVSLGKSRQIKLK